jgi:hypothetical protein
MLLLVFLLVFTRNQMLLDPNTVVSQSYIFGDDHHSLIIQFSYSRTLKILRIIKAAKMYGVYCICLCHA